MKVYDKPFIYTLSHIVAGAIAVFYPLVLWLFLVYQLLQLALDVRFFGLSREIRPGNNPLHTARKLGEFVSGYSVTWFLKNPWSSSKPAKE